MIRIFLIALLVHLLPTITQSANLDSLLNLIPVLSDPEKIEVYDKIGSAYDAQGLYDEALEHFQRELTLSESLANIDGTLNAYKGMVRSAFLNKDVEKSLEYALTMEPIAKRHQKYDHLAFAYAHIARIKGSIMQDIPTARTYLLQAIGAYQKADNREPQPMTYNDLGITFVIEQDYQKAIDQYKKGLVIAEELNRAVDIRHLKSNIALAYLDLKQYDVAQKYALDALSISHSEERKDLAAFDNILIGEIYLSQKKMLQALEHAMIGLKTAKSIDDTQKVQSAYDLLIRIYKEQGDYKNATHTAEKIIAVKDSLNQSEIVGILADKEAEILLLQKNQELLELEKGAERSRLIRNGLIAIVFIASAIFILLYNRKRLLVKLQKNELARLNFSKKMEEKEREILNEKLSYQERALASKTIHIIQKNEILTELKTSISALVTNSDQIIRPQINKLNRTIDNNINFDDDWEKFKMHFDEVHPDFFKVLKQKYPILNTNDVRFCAYIKMGLSTKEIAQLMGINATSIQKARYRLKKKMDLEKSTDLIEFIKRTIKSS